MIAGLEIYANCIMLSEFLSSVILVYSYEQLEKQPWVRKRKSRFVVHFLNYSE